LKTAINVPSESKKEKNTLFIVDILKAADEKSRIRIRNSVYGSTDPDQYKNVNLCSVWYGKNKGGSPLDKDDNGYCSLCYLFYASVPPPFLNPLFTNHAIQGDEE
jgi:hypothetical protein